MCFSLFLASLRAFIVHGKAVRRFILTLDGVNPIEYTKCRRSIAAGVAFTGPGLERRCSVLDSSVFLWYTLLERSFPTQSAALGGRAVNSGRTSFFLLEYIFYKYFADCTFRHSLLFSGDFLQLHWIVQISSVAKKNTPSEWMGCSFWRSRRDLNPRYPFGVHTISSRARYDHFDTAPWLSAISPT